MPTLPGSTLAARYFEKSAGLIVTGAVPEILRNSMT